MPDETRPTGHCTCRHPLEGHSPDCPQWSKLETKDQPKGGYWDDDAYLELDPFDLDVHQEAHHGVAEDEDWDWDDDQGEQRRSLPD
jgi:hypothetical protein